MTMTSEADETTPSSPTPPATNGWGLGIALIAVTVIAVVLAGVLIVRLVSPEESAGRTVTYVVPAGTADKAAQGKSVQLMPPVVRLNVGDALVIRNDDDQTALVGPYIVKANTTLTQKFRRPQYLVGQCTLSGSGEIKIIVT